MASSTPMTSSVKSIQTALQTLKKAATKGKTKKSLLENIDNVSSSVVLLNSSAPSLHAFKKLASILRAPLISLYSNYTDAALNFSAAVLKTIVNNEIRPCLLERDERDVDKQAGWENVANSLLSGVIDFLENEESDDSKASIAKAFYSPICNFFFEDQARKGLISANLRCTAYTLLSETAAQHTANQAKLREPKLLGGRSLGMAISETRGKSTQMIVDYFAVLEVLLNLFARLLPSSSLSRQKHSTFIRDVFLSNFAAYSNCGTKIVDLLEKVAGKDWDETATKLFDILSVSEISFPQPFDVNEVEVCGDKYPQPEVSDRFYIDRTAFFINAQQEDGMYESLQIPYESVREIKMMPTEDKTTLVAVKLLTPPKLGDQPLPSAPKSLLLQVEVANDDVTRFNEALCHRNMGGVVVGTQKARLQKLSVTETGLDFDDYRKERADPPQPSLKAKVVEKFYGSDPTEISKSDPLQTSSGVTWDGVPKAATVLSVKETGGKLREPSRPSIRTQLKVSVFGRSDEDLSEIDNAENLIEDIAIGKGEKRTQTPNVRTEKPAKVITLSDDERETGPKSTARSKGNNKEPQRRVVSSDEDEIAIVEKPAAILEAARTSRSKYARQTEAMVSTPKVIVKKVGLTGRPKRAAAVTATTKLASAFPDSNDTGIEDTPEVEHTARGSTTPASTTEPPMMTLKKAARTAGKAQATENSAQISNSLEPFVLRSSSPVSKILRMKAKNPNTVAKPAAGTQKRSSDHAFPPNDEETSRKKLRTKFENDQIEIDINENFLSTPRPLGGASSRPPQKYGSHGRKVKTSPSRKESVVDWDQVPIEEPIQENILAKKDSQPSHVLTSKLSKSAKAPASKIVKPKKENILKQNDDQSLTPDLKEESKNKSRLRARAPLQTIVQDSNTAETEKEAQKATSRRVSRCVARADEENKQPSLEDILLKGATIDKADSLEPVNNDDNKTADVEKSIVFNKNNMEIDMGISEDLLLVPTTVKFDEDEPSTPLSKKPANEILTTPVSEILNEPTKAHAADVEMINLTGDDVKEALHVLRTRRAEGSRGVERSHKLPDIPTAGLAHLSPFLEEDDVQEQHRSPSRLKVKFDEKPRYKSASLESLMKQDLAGTRPPEQFRRKARLLGEKLVPRGAGLAEPLSHRKHDGQLKKEPGMEEIVNV
ncbi:hypothetical protein DFH11DRAFT_1741458, partial [Phellopilus nigrolimitatus]